MQRDPAAGGTAVTLTSGHAALAPYSPPDLVRVETLAATVLVVRLAMVAWAFALALVALRADGDAIQVDRAVHGFTVIGIGLAVVWFLLGLAWSVQRTRNVQRLDGRFPTMSRSVRVWAYAPAWVVLMSLTLVQLEPNKDLDVRPPIIVAGFVIAMFAPYRLVQRIFRTLVRTQPDAAVWVLFVVDSIAFGLMWWRLINWPSTVQSVDAGTIDFLIGSSLAAAVALLVGLLFAAYLDRETDRSEDIRLLALRTRHDHRLARLQGLDPMDRATRWALWMARQAADRAADVAAGHTPPAAAGSPLVVDLPTSDVSPSPVGAQVQSSEPAPVPVPIPAPLLVPAPDALARALDRRRDEAERHAARVAKRTKVAPVVPEPAAPVDPATERLAELAAVELAHGAGPGFATRMRELSLQYPAIDVPPVRGASALDPFATDERPPLPPTMRAPRLIVVELLRYLTIVVLGVGAVAAGWVLVGASRITVDSSANINELERARSVAVLALVGGNVLTLGWMVAAGWYARRVEPSLRWISFVALLAAAAPLTVVAAVLEGGAAGPFSLAALLVATVGALVGVRFFAIANETFGLAAVPVNAWFVDLAAAVMFVLISPLGSSLEEQPGDGLAFGATVVGLTLLVAAVLSGVVMSDFEDALRSSSELARAAKPSRVKGPRRAPTPGTP